MIAFRYRCLILKKGFGFKEYSIFLNFKKERIENLVWLLVFIYVFRLKSFIRYNLGIA